MHKIRGSPESIRNLPEEGDILPDEGNRRLKPEDSDGIQADPIEA